MKEVIEVSETKSKMQGVVKFFSASKGYGFLTGQDGQDYFVHFSSILIDGFKSLADGEAVEFEVVQSPKGLAAANVTVL
jgi:CspA family cold shock protein